MARKFRCPKCNEIFVGKMAHCPKCGIELHYQNENEIQKKEVVETNSNKPTFHFDDDDIIKSNIQEDVEPKKEEKKQEIQAPAVQNNNNTTMVYNNDRYRRVSNDLIINREELSYFDGNIFQKIGWKILALLLFIVTGTLGLPWAVCISYRWECKHTVINGKRLKFDGKGSQLFGRYLLWLLLSIITFGIFLFWLSNNIKKWKIKHTVFESVYNINKEN